jgi:hypothetical protein
MYRRYQFALNSDNLAVVRRGLLEIIDQIYHENVVAKALTFLSFHNVINSFTDYFGIVPLESSAVVRNFLISSPQLEEFFKLWESDEGNGDPVLCCLHLRCLSLFLFLVETQTTFYLSMANRVFKNYSQHLLKYLKCRDRQVFSHTLVLIVSCLRIKGFQLPENILQCLLEVNFLPQKDAMNNSEVSPAEKIVLDVLPVPLISLYTYKYILDSQDPIYFSQLIAHASILGRIIDQWTVVETENLSVFFSGFLSIFRSYRGFYYQLPNIFQNSTCKSLTSNRNDTGRSLLVDTFLHELFAYVSEESISKNKQFLTDFYLHWLEYLSPMEEERHKKV